MGGDMSKVISGVYIGSYGNATNEDYLESHKVTHVLAIHNLSEEAYKKHKKRRIHKKISLSDINSENISRYFSECNDFIHEARLSGGNCLVHCQMGISRSVAIVCAYIMSITHFTFHDSLTAIQGVRSAASPNFGFRKQLEDFQKSELVKERQRLIDKFGESKFLEEDLVDLKKNIECRLNADKKEVASDRSHEFLQRLRETND